MEPSGFELEMDVDEHGVLIARLIGVFDFHEWQAQREDILSTALAHTDLTDCPLVADFRKCEPPVKDWLTQNKNIICYKTRKEERHCRRALVVKPNAGIGMSLELFTELEYSIKDVPPETRTFEHFTDAYAWATENWPSRKT